MQEFRRRGKGPFRNVHTFPTILESAKVREVSCVVESLKAPEAFAKVILYEDNHLLVVDKPAGIATMGASHDEESLFTLAKRYIKIKYQKPGEVYLGVVSRLDLPVSGVVVFAKTSKAAGRLNEQFKNRAVNKFYLALVEGTIFPEEEELTDLICEDKNARKLWIPRQNDNSGIAKFAPKEARLKYRTVKRFSNSSLLEVELFTGRKHQIRLQLAHKGFPIVGDGKYGARPIPQLGICLRACKLILIHPTTREEMIFVPAAPKWNGSYVSLR